MTLGTEPLRLSMLSEQDVRLTTLNVLTWVTVLAAVTSALLLAGADGARADADSAIGRVAIEVEAPPEWLQLQLPGTEGASPPRTPEPQR